ncbi:condensation domain-containing protein [Kitasatospora sp. NPDC054939]
MTETRRITVGYHGTTSGSGPLTLGQHNMLLCIGNDLPEQINKESVWPVPDGTGPDAALAALRTLLERHESLRTAFPPGPDGRREQQEVHADGEFTATVVEAGTRDQKRLDLLAAELGRTDLAVPFDLAAAPRLRFTLVTHGDEVLRLVVVVCHAGADGAATALLLQEWYALAAGRELPPVTARTPLQVAAAEQSPQGRRRTRAALGHWERILRTGPHAVFADDRVTGPAGPVGLLVLRSRSGAQDLAATARRTGASPSVVLLAAFAALVAHRAAEPDLVLSTLSANRQRAALADHIGTLAQDALLALDTRVDDFDQLVGRAKAASFTAYWHSTFEAEEVWRLIEDVAEQRGARYARQVAVNDLSLAIPEAVAAARPAPAADPELIRLPDIRMPSRVMFNILRVTDLLEFSLLTCPQVFDHTEAEQFAHGLLAVLRAAARGPLPLAGLTALTGVRPGTRTGEWHRIDACWTDLAAVRALLGEALGPAVTDIRVTVADDRLTAHLATTDPALTPEAAHRAVVAALPGHDTAIAPARYVLES